MCSPKFHSQDHKKKLKNKNETIDPFYYFSPFCDQIPYQNNLREESMFRLTVLGYSPSHSGKTWQLSCEAAGHSAHSYNQESKRGRCWCTALCLLFHQSRTPACEMVPPENQGWIFFLLFHIKDGFLGIPTRMHSVVYFHDNPKSDKLTVKINHLPITCGSPVSRV